MISATIKADHIANENMEQSIRKRYWVLPGLQARIILWGVLITSLLAAVAAWTILLVVWQPLVGRFMWSGSGPSIDELFRIVCIRVFLTTGLLILLFAVIAFVTGLFVSHRVAGPLYRMGRVARQIAEGRFSRRVALRKYDYVSGFLGDFNNMLDYVESQLDCQQAAFDKLEKQLDEIERLAASEKIEASLHVARKVLRDVQNQAFSRTTG